MERASAIAVNIALLISAAAFAADPSTPASTMASSFNAIDTNHDGYISRAEAQQNNMSGFEASDTNHDGRLDPNEFQAAMGSGLAGPSEDRSTDQAPRDPTPKEPDPMSDASTPTADRAAQ